MNGAIAVPSVKTIKVPNKSKKNTMGANQNFFRTFKNSQNSNSIDSLDITLYERLLILYSQLMFLLISLAIRL